MLNNGIHRVVLIIIILYMISKYFKTTENFEQDNVQNFNLMSALTKTYPTEDLYLYEINALKNYRETKGIVTKLVNNLTIDFQSFNDNKLSYHAILYNNTDKELTLTYKVPYIDMNSVQSDKIITSGSRSFTTSLNSRKYYVVYFLPINSLNQVSDINDTNYNNLNGKVINSNVSLKLDATNFNKQFNVIIYNSSFYDGTITINPRSIQTPILKNNFYLIKNKNNDRTDIDILNIKQFEIYEIQQ